MHVIFFPFSFSTLFSLISLNLSFLRFADSFNNLTTKPYFYGPLYHPNKRIAIWQSYHYFLQSWKPLILVTIPSHEAIKINGLRKVHRVRKKIRSDRLINWTIQQNVNCTKVHREQDASLNAILITTYCNYLLHTVHPSTPMKQHVDT